YRASMPKRTYSFAPSLHAALPISAMFCAVRMSGFHLNVVGYKEVSLSTGGVDFFWFHLNVVGYKVKNLTVPVPDAYVVSSERSGDRKSTRLNSSHVKISYTVFTLK